MEDFDKGKKKTWISTVFELKEGRPGPGPGRTDSRVLALPTRGVLLREFWSATILMTYSVPAFRPETTKPLEVYPGFEAEARFPHLPRMVAELWPA